MLIKQTLSYLWASIQMSIVLMFAVVHVFEYKCIIVSGYLNISIFIFFKSIILCKLQITRHISKLSVHSLLRRCKTLLLEIKKLKNCVKIENIAKYCITFIQLIIQNKCQPLSSLIGYVIEICFVYFVKCEYYVIYFQNFVLILLLFVPGVANKELGCSVKSPAITSTTFWTFSLCKRF